MSALSTPELRQRVRTALLATLAAVLLLPAGCVTDVSITGVARCDGLLQSGEETVDSPFDSDGDGFFDAANPDCPEVYAPEDLDCDDGDPEVNPGAAELECNGIDDDCDEESEDGYDADGDGVLVCDDCDDQDPENFPGNLEICDGLDNDCDGEIEVDGADQDGDGWRVCGGDCDDSRSEAYEGAPELCNGLDEDCNGLSDFDAAGEVDVDLDGSISCEDCDDQDSANFPANEEICDGADNDCNGQADASTDGEEEGELDGSLSCADCDDQHPSNFPGNAELCDGADNDCNHLADADAAGEVDLDLDGSLSCSDCDDTPGTGALRFPGNAEACDGIDNDCNGLADADAAGEVDGDLDGSLSCADCDDTPGTGALRFPGNTEVCDGIDNDCDGVVPGTETDDDGDLYVECAWAGTGSSVLGGNDCDDSPATGSNNFPGNVEDCSDGLDNDCDGVADNGCGGPPASYSGTWILSPAVNYACAFNSVTLSITALSITDVSPVILVQGLVGSQPGAMSGSFTSATDFSASNHISSGGMGCDETYTITGSFVSSTQFNATVTAQFVDPMGIGLCFDCSNQSWPVTGVR